MTLLSTGGVPPTAADCFVEPAISGAPRRVPDRNCGVFDQLRAVLLDKLGEAGRIDLERVSVDAFSLRAVKGGI